MLHIVVFVHFINSKRILKRFYTGLNYRKTVFIGIFIIIQLSLIWPVYPLFSRAEPFVLGLPFSFFWVVLILFTAFFTLLWYYLTEPESGEST